MWRGSRSHIIGQHSEQHGGMLCCECRCHDESRADQAWRIRLERWRLAVGPRHMRWSDLDRHGPSRSAAVARAADEDLQPDVVLVSTMRRAVETAEIIATPTGMVPQQRAELMERTCGEAEGLTVQEYTERYDKHHGPTGRADITRRRVGSTSQQESRCHQQRRDRAPRQDRLGCVSWGRHHGFGDTALAGGPIETAALPAVSPANTSINEWLVDADDSWCLSRYNDHTHLVALPGNRQATLHLRSS